MQRKCPNCGHDVEMPPVASPTGDYCPDCGALMTEFNSKGGSWKYALLTSLLLIGLFLCFGVGFMGACSFFLDEGGTFPTTRQYFLNDILIIVGAITVGGLCIWGLTKIKK